MGSLYELGQQLLIRAFDANSACIWGRRSEGGQYDLSSEDLFLTLTRMHK